tara:strand:+ start:358 stop:1029 length:672 start_codon:yes stop_codon:yes gene_type:complete
MKLNPKNWNSIVINNLLQFIFVFSSVYFAFWLTDRREQKELEQVEKKAVEVMVNELQNNLKALESSQPYHDTLFNKLFKVYDSVIANPASLKGVTLQAIFSGQLSRSYNTLGLPYLSNVSWDSFNRTQAFMVMDYDIVNAVNQHFRGQQLGVVTTANRLSDFFLSEAMFSTENQATHLLQLIYLFREINGQENSLITSTVEAIKLLEESYDLELSMTQKADTL